MSKLKTGRLSKEDLAFIRENAGKMSVESMASQLNRNPSIVKKYIRNQTGKVNVDVFGNTEQNLNLEELEFWTDIQQQFNEQEQNAFLAAWKQIIEQFNRDVTYLEKIQILDVIKMDIMMQRMLKSEEDSIRSIKRLEELIDWEMGREAHERNFDEIIRLENELAAQRAAQQNTLKHYESLQKTKNQLFEKLKGTRDQRLKVLEGNKKNFPDFLSELMRDREVQKKYGERLAKISLAKEREKLRLMQYHTYEDGVVDIPFLTPDIVQERQVYDDFEELAEKYFKNTNKTLIDYIQYKLYVLNEDKKNGSVQSGDIRPEIPG